MAPLLNHSNHISNNLITEPLEIHHAFKLKPPHHYIKPLIERAGFSDVLSVGSFNIIPALVTAMVERWRPETHTFHLPVGECTITLQDVAMLLGLPVDGKAVTTSTNRNWTQLCIDLLGQPIPEEGLVGKAIKFTWLEREFGIVPEGASNRQLEQHCRAYLLQLIGGFILPDKSSNRVHMKYLPLLENIDQIKDYSWGSACLTNLYRMLCTTSTHTSTSKRACMGGCTLLLQAWFWTRIPFLAPKGALPYGWPIAKRWAASPLNHTQCPRSVANFRAEIDHMTPDQFLWLPYKDFNEDPKAYMHSNVWNTNTAMVCFAMVEWHHADRVMLQFGLVQEKPKQPVDMTKLHKITMAGQADRDWEVYHANSIELWDDRYNRCVVGRPIYGQETHTEQYMKWFLRHSRPFISGDQPLRDPRQILPSGVDDEDDDEQQVPPTFGTQTERQQYNRRRHQRRGGRQTQEMPQTFQGTHEYGQSSSQTPQQYPYGQQNDDYVPHRHSISHQEPFEQHTPFQTPHQYTYGQQTEDYVPQRHSTSEWNTTQETDWFEVGLSAHQQYSHLALLQQQLAGSSSCTVPQFIPEEPLPAPMETEPTEEEQRPPNRRPKRVPKPKKCGTGGHLLR